MPPSTPATTLSHALRDGDVVHQAIEAMRDAKDTASIEGLVEVVYRDQSARAVNAAIAALEDCDAPMVLDTLLLALGSPRVTVRIAAAEALSRRDACRARLELVGVLRSDSSWLARRAALRALAGLMPIDWPILDAATDPHWRVRHALARQLLEWSKKESLKHQIRERLRGLATEQRAAGVLAYLEYRWSGRLVLGADALAANDPRSWCDFWDWDPAVLARTLERQGAAGRRERLDAMPRLVGHDNARVRRLAAETLAADGETTHLVETLPLLEEPRRPAVETARRLFDGLDGERAKAVSLQVLRSPNAPPAQRAWAIDQIATLVPTAESIRRDLTPYALLQPVLDRDAATPVAVRAALARLAVRCPSDASADALAVLLDDPDPQVPLAALRSLFGDDVPAQDRGALDVLRRVVSDEKLGCLVCCDDALVRAEAAAAMLERGCGVAQVARLADDADARVRIRVAERLSECADRAADVRQRLQHDQHPHVRAAALTGERAASLVAEPGRETSWHVLARAARLAKAPFWNLEPEPPWRPESAEPRIRELRVVLAPPPMARKLGPAGLDVSPLGLSGHYGLPVEGFVRAVESGVNLMFWEPNYQTMTKFAARLAAPARNRLHFMAGTFEADADRVRRDAERALRRLRIERLALFMLFWVRSWRRVDDALRATLEGLRQSGKIAMFGLSTHSRPLAAEALRQGWDPLMVRHSTAHRGAEREIFPKAAESGVSIITFNATCYGRLLAGIDGAAAAAADCYRYSLAQPGVKACWTAPETISQLDENLAALADPELPQQRMAALRAQGERLYREEKVFERLIRAR